MGRGRRRGALGGSLPPGISIPVALGRNNEASGQGAYAVGPGSRASNGAVALATFDQLPPELQRSVIANTLVYLDSLPATERDVAVREIMRGCESHLTEPPAALLEPGVYDRAAGTVKSDAYLALMAIFMELGR